MPQLYDHLIWNDFLEEDMNRKGLLNIKRLKDTGVNGRSCYQIKLQFSEDHTTLLCITTVGYVPILRKDYSYNGDQLQYSELHLDNISFDNVNPEKFSVKQFPGWYHRVRED